MSLSSFSVRRDGRRVGRPNSLPPWWHGIRFSGPVGPTRKARTRPGLVRHVAQWTGTAHLVPLSWLCESTRSQAAVRACGAPHEDPVNSRSSGSGVRRCSGLSCSPLGSCQLSLTPAQAPMCSPPVVAFDAWGWVQNMVRLKLMHFWGFPPSPWVPFGLFPL